jgi:phenylpyruvate tautomerase PptA (4-oxalocrotonate tautomerase family)
MPRPGSCLAMQILCGTLNAFFRPSTDAMPSTLVEVRHAYTQAEEIALIDAVHQAVVEGFKIPQHDRNVRLVVHAPHRFLSSSDLKQPERFTVISIDAFAGRSIDAKRNLYRAIVQRLEPLGIPGDHVTILVRDLPRESWGIHGGQAASDIEMDFKIDV